MTMPGPMGETRITPKLPVHAMKTYELRTPLATHYTQLPCSEANCEKYQNGFIIGFDLTVPEKVDAANQFNRICKSMGKTFTAQVIGTTVQFTFPAGQTCFEKHWNSLDREPIAIVRGGDWRGNPRNEGRRHANLDNWLEDFADHQDKLAARLNQG